MSEIDSIKIKNITENLIFNILRNNLRNIKKNIKWFKNNNISLFEITNNLNNKSIFLFDRIMKKIHLKTFKYLINEGVSCNSVGDTTLLVKAVQEKREDIVRYIIDNEEIINCNRNKFTNSDKNDELNVICRCISSSFKKGGYYIFDKYLDSGVDPNIKNHRMKGKNCIDILYERYFFNELMYLLNSGGIISNTLHHFLLLRYKMNIRVFEEEKRLTEILLKKKYILTRKDVENLLLLILENYYNINKRNIIKYVKFITSYPININVQDSKGNTLLILAIYYGYELVKYLMQKGASLTIRNNKGLNFIDYYNILPPESYIKKDYTITAFVEKHKPKPTLIEVPKGDKKLFDNIECLVCRVEYSESTGKYMYYPCGHTTCGDCKDELKQCHCCRKNIIDKIKLF